MIKAINLKNCTPYQNASISDCKKVNFIFGANGSGKSTISAFLSGSSDSRFKESTIQWDGSDHEDVYVYNREFRKRNFQQTIPGVFTMGSATIDDINALENMKSDLEMKKETCEGYVESYRKQTEEVLPAVENQFRDDVWNQILKVYVTDYQKAFEGLRASKDRFVTEVKKRIEGIPGHEGKVCEKNDLLSRAESLYSSKPERCSRFEFDIASWVEKTEEIKSNPIWETVIAGNADVDISALIETLGSSSWVAQGRKYLQPGSMVCPFCQQETITREFEAKLESFFDTEYKRRVDKMVSLRQEYQYAAENIINAIGETAHNESAVNVGKLNATTFFAKLNLLKSMFSDNVKKMVDKITEPGIKVNITDLSSAVQELTDLLSVANRIIDAHNKLVNERETEMSNLTDDVWATAINGADSLIKAYQRNIRGLNQGIERIKRKQEEKKAEIKCLESEIIKKGKNITSVQPTIDEINRALKAYGFTNFSIQSAEGQENSYCIKRDDGTLATDTLSEGEETFLTFLYFMQGTKGSTDPERVSDKKIIVLDDPISSLDSTILYIVGAMIKDLSKNIRAGEGDVDQLFVLTHNVYFHKEASFIDGRTKQLSDVNFWIVRKDDGITSIKSYGMKNPVSTSYELLWNELRENSGASLITIQNTMRRIIENYFGIIGNKRRDEYLVEQFDNTEDKMVAKSLLYWINDGSHSIPDDLYIDQYSDAIPRYKKVFKEIFKMSNHLAHYNMMMQIENEDTEQ